MEQVPMAADAPPAPPEMELGGVAAGEARWLLLWREASDGGGGQTKEHLAAGDADRDGSAEAGSGDGVSSPGGAAGEGDGDGTADAAGGEGVSASGDAAGDGGGAVTSGGEGSSEAGTGSGVGEAHGDGCLGEGDGADRLPSEGPPYGVGEGSHVASAPLGHNALAQCRSIAAQP